MKNKTNLKSILVLLINNLTSEMLSLLTVIFMVSGLFSFKPKILNQIFDAKLLDKIVEMPPQEFWQLFAFYFAIILFLARGIELVLNNNFLKKDIVVASRLIAFWIAVVLIYIAGFNGDVLIKELILWIVIKGALNFIGTLNGEEKPQVEKNN
ncbi:ABC-type uncharacterized transport system fused permease/ATPase subunit [Clostridiales Family XIII bacterium PM5-7]